MTKEQWKPIIGYEKSYEVSSFGRIKSLERTISFLVNDKNVIRTRKERILKPSLDGEGYLAVKLRKNGKNISKRIHNLIAEAFIPNPNNLPEIDHIDRDKTNNKLENLKWCTRSENNRNRSVSRKVRCIEIDKVFNTCVEACEYLGYIPNHRNRTDVSNAANPNNNRKTAFGYHWERVEV